MGIRYPILFTARGKGVVLMRGTGNRMLAKSAGFDTVGADAVGAVEVGNRFGTSHTKTDVVLVSPHMVGIGIDPDPDIGVSAKLFYVCGKKPCSLVCDVGLVEVEVDGVELFNAVLHYLFLFFGKPVHIIFHRFGLLINFLGCFCDLFRGAAAFENK